MVPAPVHCGVKGCRRWAVYLDTFAPYHLEGSRCRAHLDALSAAHVKREEDECEAVSAVVAFLRWGAA